MKKIEIGQGKLVLNKQTLANLSSDYSGQGKGIFQSENGHCIGSFVIRLCLPSPPSPTPAPGPIGTNCMSGTPFSCV